MFSFLGFTRHPIPLSGCSFSCSLLHKLAHHIVFIIHIIIIACSVIHFDWWLNPYSHTDCGAFAIAMATCFTFQGDSERMVLHQQTPRQLLHEVKVDCKSFSTKNCNHSSEWAKSMHSSESSFPVNRMLLSWLVENIPTHSFTWLSNTLSTHNRSFFLLYFSFQIGWSGS